MPQKSAITPQASLQSMINVQISSVTNFYTYWRSWQPILGDFMPTEDLGDQFLLILWLLMILANQWRPILAVFVLVSFQFPKMIVLVTFQKASFLFRYSFQTYRSCYVLKSFVLVSFQFPKIIIFCTFQKALFLFRYNFQNVSFLLRSKNASFLFQ